MNKGCKKCLFRVVIPHDMGDSYDCVKVIGVSRSRSFKGEKVRHVTLEPRRDNADLDCPYWRRNIFMVGFIMRRFIEMAHGLM